MAINMNNKSLSDSVREILTQDGDLVRNIIQEVLQQIPDAELDQAFEVAMSGRNDESLGCRIGYYLRTLLAEAGKHS